MRFGAAIGHSCAPSERHSLNMNDTMLSYIFRKVEAMSQGGALQRRVRGRDAARASAEDLRQGGEGGDARNAVAGMHPNKGFMSGAAHLPQGGGGGGGTAEGGGLAWEGCRTEKCKGDLQLVGQALVSFGGCCRSCYPAGHPTRRCHVPPWESCGVESVPLTNPLFTCKRVSTCMLQYDLLGTSGILTAARTVVTCPQVDDEDGGARRWYCPTVYDSL